MRTLLIAYLLVCAAPTFAQGLLLPEGATGVSVSAATSLNDGVSDVGVGLCATPSPSVDLSAVVGRSPLGSGGLTTVGGAFALNIDRDSPSRAAVLAGISFVSGEQFDTAYVISVGARAGRQIPLGAARAVPNLSVNVSLLTGGNVERGVQAGASFDLPVIFGVEAVSFSVAPSVSLNSEYLQYAEGLDRFIIGLRGESCLGLPGKEHTASGRLPCIRTRLLREQLAGAHDQLSSVGTGVHADTALDSTVFPVYF